MADMPIPDSHRDAFSEAVAAFHDWNRGGSEPQISLEGQPYTVGAICNAVVVFRDPMPDGVYDDLCEIAKQFRGGPEGLGHSCEGPKGHSYASGAFCLLRLYDARVAHYKGKASQA